MTEEEIKIDNRLRALRSQSDRYFENHPQERFNLYVDTLVFSMKKPLEEVLELKIVKDRAEALGVAYTGK